MSLKSFFREARVKTSILVDFKGKNSKKKKFGLYFDSGFKLILDALEKNPPYIYACITAALRFIPRLTLDAQPYPRPKPTPAQT